MGNAVVISFFALSIIFLFPLHIDSYVYLNTRQRYAGANVCLYRLFTLFNANTVSNSLTRMQINGKEKKIDKSFLKSHLLKIYNNLTLTKIVQLGDYGMLGSGPYVAVAQNALTNILFSFVKLNGGRTKLKNYMILNKDNSGIVYYAKVSGIVNLVAIIKLIAILAAEKIHE